MTLVAILSLLMAIASVVVLPLVLGYLGLGAVGEMLLRMRGISPHAG